MKTGSPIFDFGHSLVTILLFAIVHTNPTMAGCTVGVVDKTASADRRPIAFKVRDTPFVYQRILYKIGGKYNYIGIGKAGNNDNHAAMALNDQGLALGNSLLKDIGNQRNGNGSCQAWLWANCATVQECLSAFHETITKGSTDYYPGFATMTLPIIGANGKAVHLECGKDKLFRYNPLDFSPTGVRRTAVVVRANDSHQNTNGSDDAETPRTGGNRYCVGRGHLQNAVTKNGIYENDPNGGDGVTIAEMIQITRIGEPYEGGDWKTNRLISSRVTVSAMLAHGIRAEEDPRIAVMWAALGNPDYTPFVPVWETVAAHSDLPAPLIDGDKLTGLSYQARLLYNRMDLDDYDKIVNQRFTPMETNFIQAVNMAREKWAEHGFVYLEAKRICQESSLTAWHTLKTITSEARKSGRNLNHTPILGKLHTARTGSSRSVEFSHDGVDTDGTVAQTFWEFGDGNTSGELKPNHTYTSAGTYLVMCRIEDGKGSRNSIWKYVTIAK